MAASLASLKLLENDPMLIPELQEKWRYFNRAMTEAGFPTMGDDTPIIPVLYPDEDAAITAAMELWDHGIYVVPAVYPAVPLKAPRIRFCINRALSIGDLDYIVETMLKVSPELANQ